MLDSLESRTFFNAAILVADANAARLEHGVGELRVDQRLMNASQKYAEKLRDARAMTHELGGTTPQSRAKAEGYQAEVLLENALFMMSTTVITDPTAAMHRVTYLFANHPGHREQLFDPRVSNIGVGFATAGNELYVVETYASVATRPPGRLFYRLGPVNPPNVLERI